MEDTILKSEFDKVLKETKVDKAMEVDEIANGILIFKNSFKMYNKLICI